MAIQIPPNLNPYWEELLPWVDDVGGISAEGDLVNPDTPWEPPAVYAAACEVHGLELRHRWPVYSKFLERGWVSHEVQAVIQRRSHDWPEVNPNVRTPSAKTFHREPLSKPFVGQSLTVEDRLALVTAGGSAQPELIAAADELNRRFHGDEVTYVVNRNANFTNVCVTHCSFCGFYQTSWVKLGPETAARMLRCGCNDFGGTLHEESITRERGGKFGECLSPAEMQTWIRSVGKTPRQRTTLYESLGDSWENRSHSNSQSGSEEAFPRV